MLSGCNQRSGRRERDTVIAANAPANPDVLAAWFCPHGLPRTRTYADHCDFNAGLYTLLGTELVNNTRKAFSVF